jgi:hypothetical protein
MLFPQMYNKSRGISIIELLVVILILGVGSAGLLSFSVFSLRTASLQKQTIEASFLAQDALEALKNYRDNIVWNADDPANEYDGLGVVATGVPLRVKLSLGTPVRWQLLLGQEIIGIYTRDITIGQVRRDGLSNIVESGGTLDADTKKITVKVIWQDRGIARELQAITYLGNWR